MKVTDKPHLMIVMCNNEGMTITAYSPPTQSLVKPGEVQTLALSWLASFGSPRTRQAYGEDLRNFTTFLEDHDAGGLLEVSRVHVDLWARSLEAAGYAPATRARRLASVASFYAYASSVGAVSSNPVSSVRRPKLPNYSPRLGLDLTSAPPVVKAAQRMSSQHQAIVALCLFTGLRVSEALAVKGSDIREEGGHKVLEVTSKGGRRDLVPLSFGASRLLSGVLKLNGSGELLPNLDRFQVLRMVAAIGKEAGLDRPLTPHDLRHGAATCALEAGEPLHRVQQLLRHANPLTTQRYDHSRDRLDSSAAYGLGLALGGGA